MIIVAGLAVTAMFLEVSSLLRRSPARQYVAVRLRSVSSKTPFDVSERSLGSAHLDAAQLHSKAPGNINQKGQLSASSKSDRGGLPVEVRLATMYHDARCHLQ